MQLYGRHGGPPVELDLHRLGGWAGHSSSLCPPRQASVPGGEATLQAALAPENNLRASRITGPRHEEWSATKTFSAAITSLPFRLTPGAPQWRLGCRKSLYTCGRWRHRPARCATEPGHGQGPRSQPCVRRAGTVRDPACEALAASWPWRQPPPGSWLRPRGTGIRKRYAGLSARG